MQSFSVSASSDGTELRCRKYAATAIRESHLDPVILLHGTALTQSVWRGMGWVEAIHAHRDVLTLDLRGHGRSGRPHSPAAYDMSYFVQDVLDVLDAAAVDRAAVLGYSLGGRVAFSLAHSHSDRVSALVSVAGSPKNTAGSFDRVFFPGVVDTLREGSMDLFLQRWEQHTGRQLSAQTRQAMLVNDPLALAAYMSCADEDTGVPLHALRSVTLPTLLLVGSADAERERAARLSAAYLPKARLRVIRGATHSSILRSPEACRAAAEFLAES